MDTTQDCRTAAFHLFQVLKKYSYHMMCQSHALGLCCGTCQKKWHSSRKYGHSYIILLDNVPSPLPCLVSQALPP
jgi:hypothetical protein